LLALLLVGRSRDGRCDDKQLLNGRISVMNNMGRTTVEFRK